MKAEQLLIKEQQKEIQKLRRENERLRINSDISKKSDDTLQNRFFDMFLHRANNTNLINSDNYRQYLLSSLRSNIHYRRWSRIAAYFHRFRIISVIVRMSSKIIAVIEASAILIVAATIFIVLLPLLLILSLVTVISAMTKGKRLNKGFAEQLKNKNIYVFFPSDSPKTNSNSPIKYTVGELAQNSDNFIFVVSPYTVSSYMFGKGKFYLTSERKSENVYYIRKYYFFMLRQKVLSVLGGQTTYLY